MVMVKMKVDNWQMSKQTSMQTGKGMRNHSTQRHKLVEGSC